MFKVSTEVWDEEVQRLFFGFPGYRVYYPSNWCSNAPSICRDGTHFTIDVKEVLSRYAFYASMSRFAAMPHLFNNKVLGAQVQGVHVSFLDKTLSPSDLEEVDKNILPGGPSRQRTQKCFNRQREKGQFSFQRQIIARCQSVFTSTEIWDFKKDEVVLNQPFVELNPKDSSKSYISVTAKFHANGGNPSAVIEVRAWLTCNQKKEEVEIMQIYEHKIGTKISQWMKEDTGLNPLNSVMPKMSMQLLERMKYWSFYQSLKQNYLPLERVWMTLEESTDPEKMVHEEMGIASYLLTLWKFHSKLQKPSFPYVSNFIDVGCGNGLLTLFLTLNGLSGRGIDLRKRKIWDLLTVEGGHLNLSERTLFPDTDEFRNESPDTWLVGNHSDELTPWIPIWARQNNCNFFLLPCCAYDFSGKFQRPKGSSNLSIFASYILYIKEIIEKCGYKCYIDRLQIPSTKRICLIGCTKYHNGRNLEEIEDYIESVMKEHSSAFRAREIQQRVQNCTRLKSDDGSDVVNDMAKAVLDKLVSEKNYITKPEYTKIWNRGMEKLSLKDAIGLLTDKQKALLKKQGNGIQTLMRNHSQVFIVTDGCVCLRPPSKADILNIDPVKIFRIHSKRCFLERNHPDGCPLAAETCSYKHDINN